jgi:phosphotransferase system HPr-like phosphotransfer protein
MRFKAAKGETLHFRAQGPDAAVAIAAILALVQGGFVVEGEATSPGPAP